MTQKRSFLSIRRGKRTIRRHFSPKKKGKKPLGKQVFVRVRLLLRIHSSYKTRLNKLLKTACSDTIIAYVSAFYNPIFQE